MPIAHHTKTKGDLGVAKAYADLVEQGYVVLFPATEHAPFDLVAYCEGEFVRIQVKYRAARLGAVTVRFKSFWADRHGVHAVPMDKSEVDVVCIYCPDTDECYYIRPSEHRASITLRVDPTRNSQVARVLLASRYRSLREIDTAPRHDGLPLDGSSDAEEANAGGTARGLCQT